MKIWFVGLIFLFSSIAIGQVIEIKVIDENKNPIKGARITIQESGISQNTNANGTGSIAFGDFETITLTCSAPEFESQVLTVQHTTISPLIVSLEATHHALKEVEIISVKGGKQAEIVTHVESKTVKDINTIQRTTLIEGIGTLPGVQTMSTGVGIGKPIIRGLSGSRVVSYLQGIRFENQQWGSDHGLGITDLGIQRVEIVKGPASLQFGSDALGGVIFLIDEDYAPTNETDVQVKTTYESVNQLTSTKVWVNTAFNKLRIGVGGGFNSAADYQLPSGDFVKTSFYQDRYARVNLNWGRKRRFNSIKYSFQQSFVGIPGHTHDSILHYEDLISSFQQRYFRTPRQEINTQVTTFENVSYLKKSSLHTTIGWNYNQLTELEEKITIPAVRFNTNTIPYTVKWKKKWDNQLDVQIGTQGMFQSNINAPEAEETLVLNTNTFDNGIFAVVNKKWKQLNGQLGIRLDNRSIQLIDSGIMKNYTGFNSSAGISYSKANALVRLNYSSGFRAPTAYELTANGEHHGSSRYEIGSLNLKNEFAHQIDLSFENNGEHLALIVNPFINYISNYVSLMATDSIIDNFAVYRYVQLRSAIIAGGDVGFHYHPHFAHFVHLESSYSFLYSETSEKTALDLLPQNRVLSTLKFTFKRTGNVQINHIALEHQYFERVNRFGMFESYTPHYQILNIGVSSTFFLNKQNIECNFGVKNLLNENYIPHTSQLKNFGLAQPGRSFYIQLIYNLNTVKQ